MYFKLAFRNIRKSYRDYLIYFITLTFSVSLFFAFNSFQAQQAVLDLNSNQLLQANGISNIMAIFSIFVAVVLGFLIIYANQFLIKQRRKEFGIYMLLGMPKRKISWILVLETLLIGIASLVSGIVLGTLLSQGLAVLVANLFEAKINYHFIFSFSALIFTMISFCIIFIVVMIFNTISLSRFKLLNLLTDAKKPDHISNKYSYIYIMTFILSIVCLSISYRSMLGDLETTVNNLTQSIILGSIGTLLFFVSLSGFFLKVIQFSKKIYYRKLNSFVLREVNASVRSNFISMSIICIMLLLSIGSLSTGFLFLDISNERIKDLTPYDVSYTWESGYDSKEPIMTYPNDFIKAYNIDMSQVENFQQTPLYSPFVTHADGGGLIDSYGKLLIKESDYQAIQKKRGEKPLHLKKGETGLLSIGLSSNQKAKEMATKVKQIVLYDRNFDIVHVPNSTQTLETTVNTQEELYFVVADNLIPDDQPAQRIFYNFDLKDKTNITKFAEDISKENLKHEGPGIYYLTTSLDVKKEFSTISVTTIYIGLYLGIIFLIASTMMLALQQLSKAINNKGRYEIVTKIGASANMINSSIRLQLAIYFLIPLMLAIIHSIVGITWINNILMSLKDINVFVPLLVTGSIFLLIYGIYFFITYLGYKRIIKTR